MARDKNTPQAEPEAPAAANLDPGLNPAGVPVAPASVEVINHTTPEMLASAPLKPSAGLNVITPQTMMTPRDPVNVPKSVRDRLDNLEGRDNESVKPTEFIVRKVPKNNNMILDRYTGGRFKVEPGMRLSVSHYDIDHIRSQGVKVRAVTPDDDKDEDDDD